MTFLFQIKSIQYEYYHGYDDLHDLILTGNYLTSLNNYIFSKLRKLENLCLGYNKISFIANSTFSGLTNLKMLWLDGNEISQINVYSLPFGAHIRLFNNFLLSSLEAIEAQHQTTRDRVYFTIWRKSSGE